MVSRLPRFFDATICFLLLVCASLLIRGVFSGERRRILPHSGASLDDYACNFGKVAGCALTFTAMFCYLDAQNDVNARGAQSFYDMFGNDNRTQSFPSRPILLELSRVIEFMVRAVYSFSGCFAYSFVVLVLLSIS